MVKRTYLLEKGERKVLVVEEEESPGKEAPWFTGKGKKGKGGIPKYGIYPTPPPPSIPPLGTMGRELVVGYSGVQLV